MITTINNEHKELNFSSEREQSQACLNSAEHEKNQGRKVLNVPNLRFPEFQGEWEEYRIEDITENISSGRCKSHSPNGKYNLYGSTGIIGKTDEACYEGNLVLVARVGANAGSLQIINELCGITDNTLIIKPKEVDAQYLYFFLQHFNLNRLIFGSGQPLITGGMLKKVKVSLGTVQEQNKLTKLLSLLDERIATQNKIIDKLQSLIKGIVDSTISCKPKNSTIGYVCSVSEQIKAAPNLDDIITVRLHGKGVCKSSVENLQLGATQYYHRKAGQLIYGKQNFHNGAIGIVPENLNNAITSKDIPSFDIKSSKCNPLYLLIQLQSPHYYKPAESLTTGTGSKRLKEETFLKMPIFLPDKERQDSIATLISSIMMKLNKADKTLNLLIKQKQYLLRQMCI